MTVTVSFDDGKAVAALHGEGDGIVPEHVPHVFGRFYRADPSRSGG